MIFLYGRIIENPQKMDWVGVFINFRFTIEGSCLAYGNIHLIRLKKQARCGFGMFSYDLDLNQEWNQLKNWNLEKMFFVQTYPFGRTGNNGIKIETFGGK